MAEGQKNGSCCGGGGANDLAGVLACVWQCLSSIEVLNWWISWLLTPVMWAFFLPFAFGIFIYISSVITYAYQHGILRRLMKAASERDIERATRDVIATLWLTKGQLWFGYEVRGLENIPEDGSPALLVYYHGSLPVDYYYFLSYMTIHKQRTPLSVVDRFMFKMYGLGHLLKVLKCTPGTIESCARDLSQGNLLGVSPGGVYEAQFSDHNYKVLWKNRVGFAKIALKAKVPVIPIFTRNLREAFRSVSYFRWLTMRVYNKLRWPCVPIYGGFPVKLITYVGAPIPYDPEDTPQTLRDKCFNAMEDMIDQHQNVPGNIFWALLERFPFFRKKD